MAHMFLPAANGQPGLVITRVVALEYTSSLSDRYQFCFLQIRCPVFLQILSHFKGPRNCRHVWVSWAFDLFYNVDTASGHFIFWGISLVVPPNYVIWSVEYIPRSIICES